MKVDYDSEARSLLFEFGEFRQIENGDYTEELAGCIVRIHHGQVDGIQLLHADVDITGLDEVAKRFDLDGTGLKAAAHAALAAPDREIVIEVGRRLPLSDEEGPGEAKAA